MRRLDCKRMAMLKSSSEQEHTMPVVRHHTGALPLPMAGEGALRDLLRPSEAQQRQESSNPNTSWHPRKALGHSPLNPCP